jgi:hypothetical protein
VDAGNITIDFAVHWATEIEPFKEVKSIGTYGAFVANTTSNHTYAIIEHNAEEPYKANLNAAFIDEVTLLNREVQREVYRSHSPLEIQVVSIHSRMGKGIINFTNTDAKQAAISFYDGGETASQAPGGGEAGTAGELSPTLKIAVIAAAAVVVIAIVIGVVLYVRSRRIKPELASMHADLLDV